MKKSGNFKIRFFSAEWSRSYIVLTLSDIFVLFKFLLSCKNFECIYESSNLKQGNFFDRQFVDDLKNDEEYMAETFLSYISQ